MVAIKQAPRRVRSDNFFLTATRCLSPICQSLFLLTLAACSSGGGNGNTNPVTSTAPPATTPLPPAISIGAPATAGPVAVPGNFDFKTNLPPSGTNFSLGASNVLVSSTTVSDAHVSDATLTYRGTATVGGVIYPVFDLNIPSLSVAANNVRGDGTTVTLANGGQIRSSLSPGALSYALLGDWIYTSTASGPVYVGQTVTGYATPPAGIPASGTATYNGLASGYIFVPSGTGGIISGTVAGVAALSVNFTTNAASGSLGGMNATPIGSSLAVPWNAISLSGTLSRTPNGASIAGTTAVSSLPAVSTTATFTSSATGIFGAALYGPNAQEVGGIWTLSEGTNSGGRAAFGIFSGR